MRVERLLLHVCCGPCAAYPVPALREAGFEPTGFFFNPNIHPAGEHARRRDALERLAPLLGLAVLWAPQERPQDWAAAVAGREAERCRHCYELRLRRTAREARRLGAPAFTTTLLFSIHQRHELIREVGERVSREECVPFLYRDLRLGWAEGGRSYRATGLYRQRYCGCAPSERERATPRARPAAGEAAQA